MYRTKNKVLLKSTWKLKFNQNACLDPYMVTEVQNNGTVCARNVFLLCIFEFLLSSVILRLI